MKLSRLRFIKSDFYLIKLDFSEFFARYSIIIGMVTSEGYLVSTSICGSDNRLDLRIAGDD